MKNEEWFLRFYNFWGKSLETLFVTVILTYYQYSKYQELPYSASSTLKTTESFTELTLQSNKVAKFH